jgi:hypothetical protein
VHESQTNHVDSTGYSDDYTTMASGTTLHNQNSKFCTDTLHVVGSWYNPTTCKVSASRTGEKTFEKKRKRRLIILYAPRQLGAHKMARTSPKTGYFWLSIGVANGPEAVRKNENDVYHVGLSQDTCERP